jgi:nicotinamidase-related amidase
MPSALLVIDVQVGIVEGPPAIPNPAPLLRNVAKLIADARAHGVLVVFVQNDGPEGHRVAIGSRGWAIHPDVAPQPGDPVVRKRECDAFYQTELDALLRKKSIDSLVVAGLMTQYCVDTTCRRASSLGYQVTLVADAHGTADTEVLPAASVIAHHNATLDGFGYGPNEMKVKPTASIHFGG